MAEKQPGKYLFVLKNGDPKFVPMGFSIARTWVEDKGLDLALYLMYDTVEVVKKANIDDNPDIKELVDWLLAQGVPIYTCGFCTRACMLAQNDYYDGIVVANRHIYYDLFTEREAVYY
jgi:predicted peroxiredoxin